MTNRIRFSKYQGLGNDFVMIADPADKLRLTDDAELVRRLCDRHFGIGADGVIRVIASDNGADFVMDYRNSDGSPGEMCGNGIRCLALFTREQGLTDKTDVVVVTGAGLKRVTVTGDDVRVDMGAPIFTPAEIPVRWRGDDALGAEVTVDGAAYGITCVSVGNPHAILWTDDVAGAPVATMGPLIERHEMFPNGTNVEWVSVTSPQRIEVAVWERGSGRTLACGTGACASGVAARLVHQTDPEVEVALPGGTLRVEWQGSLTDSAPVYMTGPAERSFDGEIDLDALEARHS